MFTFKFRVVLRFISYQLNNSFISIYLFDTFQVSTHYSYVREPPHCLLLYVTRSEDSLVAQIMLLQ